MLPLPSLVPELTKDHPSSGIACATEVARLRWSLVVWERRSWTALSLAVLAAAASALVGRDPAAPLPPLGWGLVAVAFTATACFALAQRTMQRRLRRLAELGARSTARPAVASWSAVRPAAASPSGCPAASSAALDPAAAGPRDSLPPLACPPPGA